MTPRRTGRPAPLRRIQARHRFWIIVVALVGAIVINVAQFPWIESTLTAEKLVTSWSVGNLVVSAYRNDWSRQRYGMYLALAAVAPGARVYIPTPSPYIRRIRYVGNEVYDGPEHAADVASKMYTFGRAASVSWVASPARLGPGIDPMPYVVASGLGGQKGAPWLLAVDPSRMPPGPRGNPDNFLDTVVTAEGPTHSTPVRSFALIQYQVRRSDSVNTFPYLYQDLLIETSLLPARLRAGLG